MSKVLIIGSSGVMAAVSLFDIEALEETLKRFDDSYVIVGHEDVLLIDEELQRGIAFINEDKFDYFLHDYKYEIDIETESEDYDDSTPIHINPQPINKKLEGWYPTGFT